MKYTLAQFYNNFLYHHEEDLTMANPGDDFREITYEKNVRIFRMSVYAKYLR